MASAAVSRQGLNQISSFGFSGAGFLTCYHLGVAHCLLKHGLMLGSGELPNESSPTITGVSGGALVATAVSVGISPHDGMNATLEIAKRARQEGGLLDHLQPGFSLIDQVEDVLLKLTRDFDQEFVLRRVENGRLRIGLADSDVFPHFRHNPKAYLAVDQYESLDEIVSACVLSSYLPGLTGPFLKISHLSNGAAGRASRHLMKMTERGAVKRSDGSPVQPFETAGQEIRFWDGGLVNGFPVLGADTCLITPFTGNFSNPSISPCHVSPNGFFRKTATISEPLFIAINDRAKVHLSRKNVHAARCVALSSDDHVLESWFDLGYNEAQRFLNERNLETVYSAPTGMIKQTATSTDTLV